MGDGTFNRFDTKGKGRATPKNDELALDLSTAEEGEGQNGHAGGAFMQMQLVEQQVRLLALFDDSPIFTTHFRTRISNNALLLSSPLKRPLQNSVKFLPSSLTWSPNNEKQYSGSMKTL